MKKICPIRLLAALFAAFLFATAARAVAQETVPAPAPGPAQALVAPADADPSASATTEADPNRPLPEEMTVTAMFLHANGVVRAVMITLVTASILTWTILLAKGI